MNALTIPAISVETLKAGAEAAAGRWTGCIWRTSFGPHRLNLQGVRSHQAHLMAEATSGEEASAWEEARQYLEQVEKDAEFARKHATEAVAFFQSGRLDEAIVEADKAVALESKYHDSAVWKPFRAAIAGQ